MTTSIVGAGAGATAEPPAPRTTLGWRVWTLVVVAALSPFNVAAPGTESASLLYLRPLLALVLIVGALLSLKGAVRPPRLLALLVGTWLVAIWLSALLSADVVLGASGAIRLTAFGLVAVATARTVATPAAERAVLAALVAGAAAAAVLGLAMWAAGPEPLPGDPFFGSVTRLGPLPRLTRPWSHANVAAMALGASLPAVLVLRRRGAALVLPLLAVATVATYSRGGVAAMAAAAVVVAVTRRRKIVWAGVAAAMAVAVVAAVAAPGWTGRLTHPGPDAWLGAEIAAPDRIHLGPEGAVATIEIVNRSTVTWPATGERAVVVSARWVLDDAWVVAEHRWALPNDLGPGDELVLPVAFDPVVAPGTYEVYWDLLDDGEAYFLQFSGRRTSSVGVAEPPAVALGAVPEPTRLVTPAAEVGRLELWRLALDAFADRPVLGVGPAQLTPAVQAEVPAGSRLPSRHAHNVAIESLATTGIAGTVPLLVILGWALWRALRRAWCYSESAAAAIAAGLSAAAIHAMVDWPLIHTGPAVVIGVLVGLAWRAETETGADAEVGSGGFDDVGRELEQ